MKTNMKTDMKMNTVIKTSLCRVGVTAALALALTPSCASTTVPRELADARVAYSRASSSPQAQLVPGDMAGARDALSRAERQYADDGDAQSTRDLAYVAQRRAITANANAEAARATRDKQMALADLEQARQRHAVAVTTELERSRRALSQAEIQAASERQARAAADQKAQDMLAKIRDLKMENTERGLILTLSGGVLFVTGKSSLLGTAQERLRQVAAALKDDPRPVLIVGHTDNTGKEDMNLRLSQERADSVRKFLVQQGVPESRLKTQGMGEAQPIASNQSPEGRANNRRVEIILENGASGATPTTTPRKP